MTDSGTEPVVPGADAVGEPSASVLAWVESRVEVVEREVHRLRIQVIFLFAFMVVALIVASVRAQLNADRIELDRWTLCQDRVVAVSSYNADLPPGAKVFPMPQCGPDPRTD